ncbi:MAG: hypothetical protein EXR49_08170 [Dehalococcoidia bacterium]|nr:hypothetical protein [Dehalococcoidia bacterium]
MKTALTSSRVTVATEDEAQAYFYEHGWTDGLPVVAPTAERVEAMIAGSGMAAGESAGMIMPGNNVATIEKIAVNAVMAGCAPSYMPVVVAAVKALVQPAFNLHAIQATTNPAGPQLVINGPVRKALEINSGAGCFGPGRRANATIGRAIRLVLVNIGGATPGEIDKATQGWPGKFTLCFGENEEESPWGPLHVERGFQAGDSVVTVAAAQGSTNVTSGSREAEDLIATIAHSMVQIGCNNFRGGRGEPMLVLCPQHAKAIADAGYTKDTLKQRLFEVGRFPLASLPPSVRQQRFGRHPEVDPVPFVRDWKQIIVAVAGGPGGLHDTIFPTFGDTIATSEKIAAG